MIKLHKLFENDAFRIVYKSNRILIAPTSEKAAKKHNSYIFKLQEYEKKRDYIKTLYPRYIIKKIDYFYNWEI